RNAPAAEGQSAIDHAGRPARVDFHNRDDVAAVDVEWQLIPVFIAIGCVVGFLAGLLGIGGAMTMIPVLTVIFGREHFPSDHVVHMAIATSLATIVFTSVSSTRAHARRGAVLWHVVLGLTPGILLGSLVGPQIVAGMSSALLAAL